MTSSIVTATPASLPVSAGTPAVEASAVSADVLALLLLTIAVGTPTSPSESEPIDDPDPATAALDVTTLGATALRTAAVAAAARIITPARVVGRSASQPQ